MTDLGLCCCFTTQERGNLELVFASERKPSTHDLALVVLPCLQRGNGAATVPLALEGGCAWRGTKDSALVSAGMRPGCGLKYRVGWVSLPGTLYRPNQPLKANPTVDSKALFHRRRGNGGALARVRAWTRPLWKEGRRKRERKRESESESGVRAAQGGELASPTLNALQSSKQEPRASL